MENALYYTLSTIAQTLAGALAILVAAVLFKLSSLAKEQELAADTLRSDSIDPDVYLPIAREQGFDAMAKEIEERHGWIITGNQRLRRACAAATAAYQDWGRINRRLYIALGFTVADIGLCFFLLPFTPALRCHRLLAVLVLGLAVVLGIASLLLYVWLIVAMVRRPPGVGQ